MHSGIILEKIFFHFPENFRFFFVTKKVALRILRYKKCHLGIHPARPWSALNGAEEATVRYGTANEVR